MGGHVEALYLHQALIQGSGWFTILTSDYYLEYTEYHGIKYSQGQWNFLLLTTNRQHTHIPGKKLIIPSNVGAHIPTSSAKVDVRHGVFSILAIQRTSALPSGCSTPHPGVKNAQPGLRSPSRPRPPARRYLQQAAHLGAQGAELLRRRLGVELPAQQLLRDVGLSVVGGLRDAAQQRAQRLAAIGRRRLLLGRRHVGGAARASVPASWRDAAAPPPWARPGWGGPGRWVTGIGSVFWSFKATGDRGDELQSDVLLCGHPPPASDQNAKNPWEAAYKTKTEFVLSLREWDTKWIYDLRTQHLPSVLKRASSEHAKQ